MAKYDPDFWTPGRDQFGRFCCINKISGRISYNPALETSGLSEPPRAVTPPGFIQVSDANVPVGIVFVPDAGRAAGGTQGQADGAKPKSAASPNSKGTGASNVEKQPKAPETPKPNKPKQDTKQLPPPPRTPPPQRRRETEADQWSVERSVEGMKFFYNKKTGKSQFKRPDCLRKYR